MATTVELLFNGRKEIMDIIDTGGDIVKHLTRINPICPLIGADIKLDEKLGKGKYGTVFSINFPGSGARMYAAKRNKVEIVATKFSKGASYEETFEGWKREMQKQTDEFDINSRDFFHFNGIANPKEVLQESKMLYFPVFMVNTCQKKRTFKRMDTNGKITVPPGSLVCQNSITEIILSLMIGELARSNSSINFIDTFYFATCRPGTQKMRQYTFMERIDTSLLKLIGRRKKPVYGAPPTEDELVAIYLQVVHALSVLQNRYAIVHGDLHLDNVFIEKVKPETTFNGGLLQESDFLEFKIKEGSSLYIPTPHTKYIAKLGDWGLSVKYPNEGNKIAIGDEEVFISGYDQHDGNGPWLPNFYSQAYDVAFFTAILHESNPNNTFIRRIVMWMLGLNPDQAPNKDTVAKFSKYFMPSAGSRPNIKEQILTRELAHVSPCAILTNASLMGKYVTTPNAEKKNILTVATDAAHFDVNISPKTTPKRRFTKKKIASSVARQTSHIERLQAAELTPKMRKIVIEWMLEVAIEKKVSDRTFIESVAILDLYLSLVKVSRVDLQSVGCAAMYLAFEHEGIPVSEEFFDEKSNHCPDAVGIRENIKFLVVEDENYRDLPNTIDFLEMYRDANLVPLGTRFNFAKYALYVAAAEYEMLKYPADQIAACAIILGKAVSVIPGIKPFENIEKVTGFSPTDLKLCLLDLAKFCNAAKSDNPLIYKKFSYDIFDNVSRTQINIGQLFPRKVENIV